MKSTGMIRHLDELGRIVIPKELRKQFSLNYKDGVEIFTDGSTIVLKKYEPGDIFSGDMDDLVEFEGKKVSLASIKQLMDLAKKNGYNL